MSHQLNSLAQEPANVVDGETSPIAFKMARTGVLSVTPWFRQLSLSSVIAQPANRQPYATLAAYIHRALASNSVCVHGCLSFSSSSLFRHPLRQTMRLR